MRAQIKQMLPKRFVPMARELYWQLFEHAPGTGLSREQDAGLTALRCVVSYNKYGGYCVPESSRHRPAARRILRHEVHEPETIAFILAHAAAGDLVHAGAYFGDFLPALSKGCAPGARVWAFEPNSENHRCAKITLEINGLENVVLTHAGLGEKPASVRMKTADEKGRSLGGASRIVDDGIGDGAGTQTVRLVALDEVLGTDRNVSLIQLDVEGYERSALEGALGTIRRCRPTIILEVLPGSTLIDSEWFSENITRLGYRETAHLNGNVAFTCGSGVP